MYVLANVAKSALPMLMDGLNAHLVGICSLKRLWVAFWGVVTFERGVLASHIVFALSVRIHKSDPSDRPLLAVPRPSLGFVDRYNSTKVAAFAQ